ncbi:MAG TPA: metal-dependent hydrolase [Leptospiraceae bacterium]|nr:metal-dependent hydrolase [Leptospiraceae bacterium]
MKIKVRKLNFGHDKIMKKHWYKDNPVMTHFLNSLHSVFPDGERLFIRTVKYFEKEIQNPELRERVKGFIGQEVQHSLQHKKFTDTLDEQNLRSSEFIRWYADAAYEKGLEPALMKFGEFLFGRKGAERLALSVTAALEHYTAVLAETVLRDKDRIQSGMDESMSKMLLWHAAEEIEHKSAAFDVFTETAEGNYFDRMFGFTVGTLGLFGFITSGWIWYLFNDKDIQWGNMPEYLSESVPVHSRLFMELIIKALPYLRPDFHPDQIENRILSEEFFKAESEYFEKKAV